MSWNANPEVIVPINHASIKCHCPASAVACIKWIEGFWEHRVALDGDTGMGFTLIKAPPATRGAGICSLTEIQVLPCRINLADSPYFTRNPTYFLTEHSRTLGVMCQPLLSHFLVANWDCGAVLAGQAVLAERVRDLQPAGDEARQHPAVHRRREARLQHRRRPVAHHRLPREGGAAPLWGWVMQGWNSPRKMSQGWSWGSKGGKLKVAFAQLLTFNWMQVCCNSFSGSRESCHQVLVIEELF